jgi:outer membrane murein-binding lipoprotein Lpp
MKSKTLMILGGAAVGAMTLTGCGSSDNGTASTPPTLPAPTQQLDTATVLSIVQTRTSETTQPFAVDAGAVTVVPADDETGTPIMVNGA